LPVTLLRVVGPRPACRTWRDEWPGAFQELHIHRRGHAASLAAYVGTGRYSIDAWLLPNFDRLLVQLAQGGWERDDAVLIVAVFMVMRMPLAWALRDVIGPLRCAATAYAVAEVLSRRARTLWTSDATAVAPAFKLLSELARVNPTWAGLAAPGVAAGFSFVVRDVIETNYGGKYHAWCMHALVQGRMVRVARMVGAANAWCMHACVLACTAQTSRSRRNDTEMNWTSSVPKQNVRLAHCQRP
jgi:hypothetical protein